VGYYKDGSLALQVFDQRGQMFATPTVYIGGTELAAGEFLIKTWGENAPWISVLIANGIFEDTGRRVAAGYTEAQVWRLNHGGSDDEQA
jgi:hypothetical protein